MMVNELAGILIISGMMWAVFAVGIWWGFRMGRQSIDKPLAPIIPRKQGAAAVPEDPWHEPMFGIEQNRSTVEEK